MIIDARIEGLSPRLFITIKVGDRLVIRLDNFTRKPLRTLLLLLQALIYAEVQHQAAEREKVTGKKMSRAAMYRSWNRTTGEFENHNSMTSKAWKMAKRKKEKPPPS